MFFLVSQQLRNPELSYFSSQSVISFAGIQNPAVQTEPGLSLPGQWIIPVKNQAVLPETTV